MPKASGARSWCVSGLVALLWCVASPDGVRSARAESAGRCLTPAAEVALRDAIAQPAFRRALENGLGLERLLVQGDHIELEVRDRADRSYGVTLVLPESKRGEPDATGGRFLFYLTPAAAPVPPEARAALLAAASIVDRAIPDAALVRCGGAPSTGPGPSSTAPPQNGGQPSPEPRYRLALALVSAAVQIMVLAAAVLFGLRTIRPRRPDPPTTQ
jgi:hypothetical protein